MRKRFETMFEETYLTHWHTMVGALRRSFPSSPEGDLYECVQDAFEAVWARSMRADLAQTQSISALARTIAWRQLRARVRRPGREVPLPTDGAELEWLNPSPNGQEHPVEVRSTLRYVRDVLLPTAAQRFGSHHANALAAALEASVIFGLSQTESARQHGVPRAYLNRAIQWVRRKLREETLA